MTGCAANSKNQLASSDDSRSYRDHYLSQTKSDPLGDYLSKIPYPHSDVSKPIAATALNFLGIKYKYGGGTPYTGFDCSGLVVYAAEKSLGLKLPRQASQIARTGTSVKRNELKKGDLVFFNTLGRRNSHVGIYLGNHQFVHAPRAGKAVRVESMDLDYWKKRYNGARRLASNKSLGTFFEQN